MKEHIKEAVRTAFKTALGDKKAAYASVPISNGTSDLARLQIQRLQERLRIPLINPLTLQSVQGDGWGWDDWMHGIWYPIIKRHVTIMYMCDGWENSKRCLAEYEYAEQLDIPVVIASEFEL